MKVIVDSINDPDFRIGNRRLKEIISLSVGAEWKWFYSGDDPGTITCKVLLLTNSSLVIHWVDEDMDGVSECLYIFNLSN